MNDRSDVREERVALETSVNQQGLFEVLAISAGMGNGWEFTARALQDRLRCGTWWTATWITSTAAGR